MFVVSKEDWDKVIFLQETDGTLRFFPDNLDAIITPVKSLPVIVVSVAGIKRTGKSFLLNQLIERLENNAVNGVSETNTSCHN